MIITSKENKTIKDIKKLKDKKSRKESFIIEGYKMIDEAIKEKQQIDLIVINEEFKNDKEFKKLNKIIDAKKLKYIEVTNSIFKTLTDVITPQGVLAIINKNSQNSKIDYSQDFFIVLDEIQDPGNLGTIIRTADAAGIKQIIVSKNTVNCYSSKVIRSTMGAIFRIDIIETENIVEQIKELQKNNFKVIATTLDASKSIYKIDYKKTAVVIGNEANGVSKEIQKIANEKIKIPMPGKAESLNAAIATGIIMYEYVRQKIN